MRGSLAACFSSVVGKRYFFFFFFINYFHYFSFLIFSFNSSFTFAPRFDIE